MPDKQINVHVTEETHRAYKTWCARRGMTMVDVIRVFILDILDTREREPPDYSDPKYYHGRTRLFKGDPPEEAE